MATKKVRKKSADDKIPDKEFKRFVKLRFNPSKIQKKIGAGTSADTAKFLLISKSEGVDEALQREGKRSQLKNTAAIMARGDRAGNRLRRSKRKKGKSSGSGGFK